MNIETNLDGKYPRQFVPIAKPSTISDFSASDPIVRLHEPTFSAEEIDAAALDCLLTTRVTMGQKVKTFEMAFSASGPFGPSVMVNSGSSANLLAIAALANPGSPRRIATG